ncbi:ABC transporter ATP-binding protein [Eubacterium coprostanoligenes]|uniref:ABC-type multidrug transport system, ATPase and permease component n=2 Tax=Eubacterium coprostanoligenes TaxID=290054 RepID=A0A1T4NAU9_9FIRM|nr:ABC transporter ATP-binding protein [Eubacterium coprostanoligenes]MDD6665793.1 ABC transporter ATP-binding protein [Eubacterium coprostanoligenes]MDD7357381.1 ABC transporter ATP-binding protein [Eubacterium coprostanoligenes]SJZ76382.1 ABC-type multidrug transport system, ATPase and permease component [Eubacterium coprostanoligenes]
MKQLLPFLKNYKIQSVLAPLFKMLEAVFELIVPLVVASIINDGIREGNLKLVVSKALLLVLLAVVGMSAAITAQFFAAKAATGFATEVRHSLFEKIQSFSFNEIDRIGTSTLITRMTNDVNQAQSTVNMVLRLFLRSPFIVVGALVMALTIDAKISLIFLLVIVLLSVVVAVIMKCTVPMYKNVQNTLDSVTLMTRENLTGARVIRAFTEEDDEYNKFKEKNNLLAHFQRSVGRISALMNPITYIIINLGIVLLIYSGALKVESGTLNQGQVVALYNYMSQILVELVKFASLIVTITKGFASGGRIASILNVDNTLEHSDDTNCYDNHAVCFDNVSLTYKGAGEESLTDISFFADKGQTVGIIGSTGSGKSSLVSLIPHYYDATKGRVTVNGRDVKSVDKEELRSNIGFVMQKAVLFAGTVRDNIKWGKKDATDEEINEALRIAQVYDNVYEKDGLDTVIEQNGANLSGGQKQRLSIARAIVSKPEIIVLDDSASALDFATEKALREAILSLDYKPTLFIVSERTSSILSADKIIVLEDGQIVDVGTNEQLLKSCEVYREIYFSQFSEEEVAVGD